jgi:hypothetical protein
MTGNVPHRSFRIRPLRSVAWLILTTLIFVGVRAASTPDEAQLKGLHVVGETVADGLALRDLAAPELTVVNARSSDSVAGGLGSSANQTTVPAVVIEPTQWLPAPIHIVSNDPIDAKAQAHKLTAAGFGVEIVELEQFAAATKKHKAEIWWITNAAAAHVSRSDAQDLLDGGARILLDGYSKLSDDLLELDRIDGELTGATMFGEELFWEDQASIYKPRVAFTTLLKSAKGNPVLLRSGKILWSLPKLVGRQGVEKFPFLPQILQQEVGLLPRAAANETELYVDPDLEVGVSLTELAQRWKMAGIRRVHVAGWKDNVITKARYNYSAFVDSMHEVGIEVFAWLEWPHINFSYWKMHPECKEITATGRDAEIFWRQAVALYVPACFDFAYNETLDVLESAAFDGVNVAELSFESPGQGPDNPSEYTPFHPEIRKRYKASHGVDPIAILDPKSPHFWKTSDSDFTAWKQFRVQTITDLHQKLLARLRKIPAGRKLMVTLIEDRSPLNETSPQKATHPLGDNLGSSTVGVAGLLSEGPFELQIEDPFTVWMLDPERYKDYPKLYPEVPTDQLVLDVNIVKRELFAGSGRVTSRSVGLEFYLSVASVGRSGAQLALYASATLNPQDLQWARYALAAGALELKDLGNGSFTATATRPIYLQLIRPAKSVVLDGKTTALFGQREILIPIGKHQISVS